MKVNIILMGDAGRMNQTNQEKVQVRITEKIYFNDEYRALVNTMKQFTES
jgi:hypothetical protein